MVENDLAFTRSNDAQTIAIDFSGFTPAVDLVVTDELIFRIEDKVAPRLIKRNAAALGSDSEIAVDVDTDIITITLTANERNALPNAGFDYKLTLNGVEVVYGDITVSGTVEEATTETYVTVRNGVTVREIDAEFLFVSDKFLRYDDDIVTVINTTTLGVDLILEDPTKLPGKKYTLTNKGTNGVVRVTLDEVTLFTLGIDGESCIVECDGTDWIITSGKNRVYNVTLSQTSTADPTVAATIKNSVGTIVWARSTEAEYTGTLDDTFLAGKLMALPATAIKSGTDALSGIITRVDDDTIKLSTYDYMGRPVELEASMNIYFELTN